MLKNICQNSKKPDAYETKPLLNEYPATCNTHYYLPRRVT